MFDLGFSITQMGARLGVSHPTIYKLLSDAGIDHTGRFNSITNAELDRIISEIKISHPNAGETNIIGNRIEPTGVIITCVTKQLVNSRTTNTKACTHLSY